jgi:hypothetical protein
VQRAEHDKDLSRDINARRDRSPDPLALACLLLGLIPRS